MVAVLFAFESFFIVLPVKFRVDAGFGPQLCAMNIKIHSDAVTPNRNPTKAQATFCQSIMVSPL
jgi:hypothetical protein